MKGSQITKVLDKASDKCKEHGAKLTAKRKLVLQQLVETEKLLSAYELVELIRVKTDTKLPAMSVYRILDFLESINLVHKLESQNKYLACMHITCEHKHESPQFMICQNCFKVKELDMSQSIIEEISDSAKSADFQLINPTLEIKGVCQACQTKLI